MTILQQTKSIFSFAYSVFCQLFMQIKPLKHKCREVESQSVTSTVKKKQEKNTFNSSINLEKATRWTHKEMMHKAAHLQGN